jgi:hypothetical protein
MTAFERKVKRNNIPRFSKTKKQTKTPYVPGQLVSQETFLPRRERRKMTREFGNPFMPHYNGRDPIHVSYRSTMEAREKEKGNKREIAKEKERAAKREAI